MSLNWNASKVKDWDKLSDNQKAICDVLIWLTMAIGLGGVTEKNAKEFHARVQMIEKLFGAHMNRDGKPKFITLEEIQTFIGLTTNVSTMTRTQFNKNVLARFYRERGLDTK